MSATVVRGAGSAMADVAFAAEYPHRALQWQAPGLDGSLDLAVVDVPADGPERGTFLLCHGEPSWSHLYEAWLPRLTAAGYRCVAVDQPGFGRSDKPTDDAWYSYERHCAALRHVIDTLDLDGVHLVVQDWAGPIGLRQAVDQPGRFARLFVFNTWLHTPDFPYSDGIRWWQAAATDPAQLGGDMPTGRIVAGTLARPGHDTAAVAAAYDAPFASSDAKAGARAWPAMIPFADPERGGAAQQHRCAVALTTWTHCPVHLAFGDADLVFTYDGAERWAAQIPGATLDRIRGAGHFVQLDAPDDCLAVIERHLAG